MFSEAPGLRHRKPLNTGVSWQGGATSGAGGMKMAPGVKPRKPLPRPALRGGVVCGGGEKAPLLYPAPKSSPAPLRPNVSSVLWLLP